MRHSLFGAIVLFGLLTACAGSGDNGDHEIPTITIYSPTQNAAWAIGDTVHIHARLTDNDQLNQALVTLIGPDEELYYDLSPIVSGDSVYIIDQHWVVSGVVNPPKDATLTISATDMNGNVNLGVRTVTLYQ